MNKEEKQEYIMHIESLYDTLMNIKEERDISYGEIAHIESLGMKQLQDMENEIYEELERIKKIIEELGI